MSELICIVGFCLLIGLFIYLISFYDKNNEHIDESDNDIYNSIVQNLDQAKLTTNYNQISINGVLINLYDSRIYVNGSCLICAGDSNPIMNKIRSLQMVENKLRAQTICSKLKGETCQS